MEQTGPGQEALVFKCTVLDARVVEHVAYLVKVPVAQRAREAIARADKYEEESKENERQELVERLGLPMLRDLRECGFLGEYGKGGDTIYRRPKFGRGGTPTTQPKQKELILP